MHQGLFLDETEHLMNTTHGTAPTSPTRRRTPIRFSVAALAAFAMVATAGTAAAQEPARNTAPAAAQAGASTVVKAAPGRAVPRIVREWEAAWNTGDGHRMAALFVKDGVYQDFSLNYRFTGRAQVAQFVKDSVHYVTGLHVTVTDAFRTGDRVALRFVFKGQLYGAPHAFSVPVLTVMELKGDKITYDGDYYNRLDVLRQSGLDPDPSAGTGKPTG